MIAATNIESVVESVMAHVTEQNLAEALVGLIERASPTGRERILAEWIATQLEGGGLTAKTQVIDGLQANAVAVLGGTANDRTTLLYAPIDTFTTGDASYDVPGAALAMRADMLPQAVMRGDLVQGLGAGNPKGHAACVLVTLKALAASKVTLRGSVVGGFGAGGMPSFAIDGVGVPGRENTGHGVGASFMLERGFTTDRAIIAKPGWAVSHEEVGLVWLDVHVPGIHTYVGSRHRLPYRNAVAVAGVVAQRLEDWLEQYAVCHEFGTMQPQGVVSSVSGGLQHLAASTPAEVRMRLDLRLTTEQTPASVTREVRSFVTRLNAEFDTSITVEQIAGVPATRTDPDSPVIRAVTRAWEVVAGHAHEVVGQNSGATDANILRMRGVPTARVGMPKVVRGLDGEPVDFTLGMNLADVRAMMRLVEVLVRSVLVLDAAGESDQERGVV